MKAVVMEPTISRRQIANNDMVFGAGRFLGYKYKHHSAPEIFITHACPSIGPIKPIIWKGRQLPHLYSFYEACSD